MDTNFSSIYDIQKRLFKCCSVQNKEVFVFLNIYFLESGFKKDEEVTWLIRGERLYGSVISVDSNNKVKIKSKNKKGYSIIDSEELNIVHEYDKTISQISENISKGKQNKFDKINKEQIENLKGFIGVESEVDIIDELMTNAPGAEFVLLLKEKSDGQIAVSIRTCGKGLE